MQCKISSLDNRTLVVEVEVGDEGPIVEMLNSRGLGCAVYGDDVKIPFAVIDRRMLEEPGFTPDHLLAVEAHELGHIHHLSDDEPTAEQAAIALLEALNEEGAAALLRSRGIV